MWNGHRMLRHRGHRDELTEPTSSQNGGTIIRGILFGCQDSSHRQNISSLSSMIDLLFFLLFIRLIFLFSSLASRGSKPIFCFPFSVFQVFVLVSSAFFSSFSFFFLPLFFCCSSPLLRWLYLAEGETYRTTDNYIFRHARLLWRIMGEWVFLEKSWGDSRWWGYSTRVLLVLIIGC